MYMVLKDQSPRASKRGDDEWYENLPGALSDIGEFIDNAVSLPFAVGNLGLGWIRQKCLEWSPDPLYPGKTIGDGLKAMHKGSRPAAETGQVLSK